MERGTPQLDGPKLLACKLGLKLLQYDSAMSMRLRHLHLLHRLLIKPKPSL
jgi:hypothetical protein